MLPSPGFSIPSIGTPIHHPDEDQQILPQAQQQQQEMPPLMPIASSPKVHSYPSGFGFGTPQSLMHPQTPVSRLVILNFKDLKNYCNSVWIKETLDYHLVYCH